MKEATTKDVKKWWKRAKRSSKKKFKVGTQRFWKYTMGTFKGQAGVETILLDPAVLMFAEELFDEKGMTKLTPIYPSRKNQPIGKVQKGKSWLRFISADPLSTNKWEVVLKISGTRYKYVLKTEVWDEFLRLAKKNRGKAMAYLKNNNLSYQKLELFNPFVDYYIGEKFGDKPDWLKVDYYVEWGNNAELILSIGGKTYWFPVSPKVAERFRELGDSVNRGTALQYLKEYIRRYRGYTGRWTKSYYNRNRIKGQPWVRKIEF